MVLHQMPTRRSAWQYQGEDQRMLGSKAFCAVGVSAQPPIELASMDC